MVFRMLGDFHGGYFKTRYTPEKKKLVLEGLRQKPMVTFTPRCTIYSTSIIGKPLSQKWWHLQGDAEYSEAGKVVQAHAAFIAYLQKGRWVFTPATYLGCPKRD
jgi:hypothetical protein